MVRVTILFMLMLILSLDIVHFATNKLVQFLILTNRCIKILSVSLHFVYKDLSFMKIWHDNNFVRLFSLWVSCEIHLSVILTHNKRRIVSNLFFHIQVKNVGIIVEQFFLFKIGNITGQ